MTLVTDRETIKRKAKIVEELDELVTEYDTIGIANLHKVRAIQLQQLSKKLRKDLHMAVVKKTLLTRALQNNKKPNIGKLIENLEGSNIMLFTDMDPFKLAILLDKNKTKMTAKGGDIAPDDILIPSGNTGLPPGPAISELHDAGLRTKIDLGSVWVVNDTVVVKKGEVIEPKVASVLSKLGVKPFEVGLTMRAAYDNGWIFTSDQLRPKVEEIRKQLLACLSQALNLAVNSTYYTPLTVKIVLQQATSNARNLAINTNYASQEVISEILAKAHSHVMSLVASLSKINKDAVPLETQ